MSRMKTNCPICGNEIENFLDKMDSWLICEDFEECDKCGYSYHYAYGNTNCIIDYVEFEFSYHDTEYNELQRLQMTLYQYLMRSKRFI